MKRPRSSLDRVGYFLLHLKKTCNFFVSADPNLPALGIYFIDILQVTKTVLAISKLRPMSFPITFIFAYEICKMYIYFIVFK